MNVGDTVSDTVRDTVRDLVSSGRLDLPNPGAGFTAERHLALFDIARRAPVSVARLVEAHTDAVSILAEAGAAPRPGAVYGVWASAAAGARLRLTSNGTGGCGVGGCEVDGVMPFASGLGIVDRALLSAVDARPPTGERRGELLADVTVAPGPTVEHDTSGWNTPALADSATGVVRFRSHPVALTEIVGEDGWYLDRVGFWHGACGPAACWAGAAAGLVDAAELEVDDDPHRRAHLGGMRSDLWLLQAALSAAGDEIDEDPSDVGAARRRALSLRHAVERTVADILDRFGQALGPRPFVGDAAVNQRWMDTHLYTRQHHAERDLVALGARREAV